MAPEIQGGFIIIIIIIIIIITIIIMIYLEYLHVYRPVSQSARAWERLKPFLGE